MTFPEQAMATPISEDGICLLRWGADVRMT
jgi:hypothetical protein